MKAYPIQANSVHIPLASESIQCAVTSPPYWGLRDYGEADQIGLEKTPEQFIDNMVVIFREVWRVLRPDGTLWLNLGDSYAGSGGHGNQRDGANKGNIAKFKNPNSMEITRSKRMERGSGRWGGGNNHVPNLKPKDLVGIPWRVALALQADGWYLRSDIIWHKPNPMPEPVKDRPTKSHEYIFLLSKSRKYYYDTDAIREPIANSTANDHRMGWYEADRPERNFPGSRSDRGNGLLQPNPKGRNKRSVWSITTRGYPGGHFATFPPELPELCIKAGSAKGDLVLDPFGGAATTAMEARRLGRTGISLDISWPYIELQRKRLALDTLDAWEDGNAQVDENAYEVKITKQDGGQLGMFK